jgi:hypothetical protein
MYAEAKTASVANSVFLSHSSADDKFVLGVVIFLRRFGVSVYIDDHDKRLPKPPNTATAAILKDEIKKSGRFVVLVSPNSRFSRWIPWELGLADGFKGVAPIAILPVTQVGEESEWTKEEYFGLYPRIYKSGDNWYVLDPRDGKPWTLQGWLTGTLS